MLVLAAALPARAQVVPRVELLSLTVDDQPPPESYRSMMVNAIDPTIAPIVQCHRDRIAQGALSRGDLRLRLWVSARQVIRVTQEASTLGDAALETCAKDRIREIRLPDSAPMGGATVRFTLRFSTSGTPLPTPVTPPPTTIAPATTPPPEVGLGPSPRAAVRIDSVRGPLAAEAIAAAIPSTAFDACPAGAGDLPLLLRITRRGTMTVGQRSGSTLRVYRTRTCVLTQLRALRMPPSTAATRATITISLAR